MKQNLGIFCIAAVSVFALLSCRKNQESPLPVETHTGANTMGFSLNDANYSASGKLGADLLSFGGVSYNSFALNRDNAIHIEGRWDESDHPFELYFNIIYEDTLGTYTLKDGTFYLGGQPASDANTFITTDAYNGTVTVKYFDGSFNPYKFGTIFAGTFDMEAINSKGNTIHLSNGRFDIGNK